MSARVLKLEQLINQIRSEDDTEASSALVRLRLGEDISSIVGDSAGYKSSDAAASSTASERGFNTYPSGSQQRYERPRSMEVCPLCEMIC